MITINVTFEDEDFKKLVERKNGLSWKEFILTLIKEEKVIDG